MRPVSSDFHGPLATAIMRKSALMSLDKTDILEELGITPTGIADRQELEHLLKDVLGYPSAEMANRHRDCNRLGTLDL